MVIFRDLHVRTFRFAFTIESVFFFFFFRQDRVRSIMIPSESYFVHSKLICQITMTALLFTDFYVQGHRFTVHKSDYANSAMTDFKTGYTFFSYTYFSHFKCPSVFTRSQQVTYGRQQGPTLSTDVSAISHNKLHSSVNAFSFL